MWQIWELPAWSFEIKDLAFNLWQVFEYSMLSSNVFQLNNLAEKSPAFVKLTFFYTIIFRLNLEELPGLEGFLKHV